MTDAIRSGVLVGLSGGKDSVMLLLFLLEYRKRNFDFPILAVHVNHMIRGEEAERDEEFSRRFAECLGVEFISVRVDVPRLAKERGVGLEEAARDARYQKFKDIISSRNDVSSIAVAHNSTDNLETVVFNMLRGSSSVGISGIPPVRERIIRPLIFSEKQDILTALEESGIPFVTDSTNFSSDYTRNYIRNEILPSFKKINEHPERSVERLTVSLRLDEDFLRNVALSALTDASDGSGLLADKLRELHPAILSRALGYFAKEHGAKLENIHYSKISELLCRGGSFAFDIPAGYTFASDGKICRIVTTQLFREEHGEKPHFHIPLKMGENEIFDGRAAILLSFDKNEVFSSNVYKISIQQAIRFDIMNEQLYVRARADGDSFVAGGITRKLKKLFNDKKIPPHLRDKYPVISDSFGIIWVPGFSLADRARAKVGARCVYITYAERDGQ